MTTLSDREQAEGHIRLQLFKRFIWASPEGWLEANVLLGRLVGVSCAVGGVAVLLCAPGSGILWLGGAVLLAILSASGFYHAACFGRLRRRVVLRGTVPSDIQERFNDALAAEVARRYARRGGS